MKIPFVFREVSWSNAEGAMTLTLLCFVYVYVYIYTSNLSEYNTKLFGSVKVSGVFLPSSCLSFIAPHLSVELPHVWGGVEVEGKRTVCVFEDLFAGRLNIKYIILKYSLSLLVICLQDIICVVVTEKCGYFY